MFIASVNDCISDKGTTMPKVLGLDCGIASVGWAVLEYDATETAGRIVAAGTRMFDTPETDKERRPKSELRRMYRGQRRVIRRRRQRMNAVRKLMFEHGLMPDAKSDALKFQGIDPWAVRAKAADTLLSKEELAIALGHIARHRGFKSNAKSQGENDVEGSKMKKAMALTREKAEGKTFVQMIATGEGRKRNKEGDYSHTPLRAELEAEVRAIFRDQQRLQNRSATSALETAFIDKAFFQRGLQDSENLLVECAFEPMEKRTSKRAYSFELFRFLSRLNTFDIQEGRNSRRLTSEELAGAVKNFGTTKKITFKALRKLIKLPDTASFGGIRAEDEKLDVTSRHGNSAEGTGTLYNLLEGAAWDSLVKTPEKLDRIAEVISFREDVDRIKQGLGEIGLEPLVLEKLMVEIQFTTFNLFTGTGHISSKACRNIIPGLARGLTYDKAAGECGYDHTTSRERNAFDVGVTGKEALKKILSTARIDRSLVGSPIARKALIEAVKQVKAVVEVHGIPDFIHIELARDVGKGIDERKEIERGIEKRNKEKDKLREDFATLVGHASSHDELLRFELWRQQNGKCVYSDENISPSQLVATDNTVQVDHILPWSRFGDDSFNNKSLCTAKANQEKKGRTPFEWFGQDEERWNTYVGRVNSLLSMKGFKRRNYTIKDAAALQDKFRSRNLNDTRWTCRLLAECLKQLYPKDQRERKVFTRPGALTDRMRRGWGVQWIKKDEKGERIPDDRHHALDAIITAATTESMMQILTRAFQKEEALGSPRDFRALDQPWLGFRDEAIAAVEKVFVSRAERHRARGEAHAATIRSVVDVDGEARVFERKRVGDLKLTDLEKVKDADRNAAVIGSLRSWIEAGKSETVPPLSPKGDPISKVTLLTNKKPDVIVREGAVDRGEMARVDVFRKKNKKGLWEFYLVPIYPHQIAQNDAPPVHAVLQAKPEAEWTVMNDSAEFLWPIGSMNYLEAVKRSGEIVEGYFRGLDRATGNIAVSLHNNSDSVVRGLGVKTLASFKKVVVDRLGNKSESKSELRTWRGKVCISASPQG
jgi:CRISPR-associated endonuclease Csn1